MGIFNFLSQTSYTFEGEKPDENVVLFLHRHWFTIISKFIVIGITALLPFVVLLIGGQYILEYNLVPFFAFLTTAFFMILWYMTFYFITMYMLDYWIITNERIVNNLQNGFFSRTVSELTMATIQDISIDIEGMIPTTMNYGSVEIQTAAKDSHFMFEDVPNPQSVKDTISKFVDQVEDRKEGMESSVAKQA